MKRREIFFYSGPGLKLEGGLCLPDDGGDGGDGGAQIPAIVLCAGPGTGRGPSLSDLHHSPNVSRRLTEAGYAVLTFHYRGVGGSEGPLYRLMPLEMAADIRSAITFLSQQPEVDASRLGLWGATTGGANVSHVAGVDARVKCTVSVSGIGDLGRWQREVRRYWEWCDLLARLETDRVRRVQSGESELVPIQTITGFGRGMGDFLEKIKKLYPEYRSEERLISLESIAALLEFRPETVVPDISPRAVMWLRGGEDTVVPVAESKALYAAAGEPKKLVTLPGLEHEDLYFDDGFDLMMQHSVAWFQAHL